MSRQPRRDRCPTANCLPFLVVGCNTDSMATDYKFGTLHRVYPLFDQRTPATGGPKKKTSIDAHAGESETSKMMIVRPDLLHQDRATSESGADQHRLNLPEGVYTGIWWYARFPDHYAGEGSAATRELGEYQMKWWVDSVSKVIVAIKADDVSLKLQNEFYEKSAHPQDTPQ